MNNNQENFNPTQQQPVNNPTMNTVPQQPIVQPQPIQQPVQQPVQQQIPVPNTQTTAIPTIQPVVANRNASIQQQMNSIPTIDQDTQQFINNTQAVNTVKKEERKEGPNIIFIVILFVIIFAAIFFLFPYLLNIIG